MIGPGFAVVAGTLWSFGVAEAQDIGSEHAETLGEGRQREAPVWPPRDARTRPVDENDEIAGPGVVVVGPEPEAIPASGRVVLRNSSDANHMFGLAKLKRGKTVDDFAAWIEKLRKGNETAPPVRFNVCTESGVVGAGRAMSLRYDLPAGEYVLVCWWPDTDMENMPHVMMGMFRGVQVG